MPEFDLTGELSLKMELHMLRPITEKVHSGNGPVSLVPWPSNETFNLQNKNICFERGKPKIYIMFLSIKIKVDLFICSCLFFGKSLDMLGMSGNTKSKLFTCLPEGRGPGCNA